MSDRLDIIDQVDTLHICLQAVTDLLSPTLELQETQRDGIAVLMAYLLEHQHRALRELQVF